MNLKVKEKIENFIIFQNLISNIPMIFFALDKNWNFTLSEGKGLNPLGLKANEVLGLSAKVLYKDFPDIIRAIEQSYKGESVHIEHKFGEFYFENYLIPILNIDGSIEGIAGATIDITERKKTELELKKTQQLQRAIIDSVPGMLYLYDAQGDLVFWNKAHENATGYSSEELNHFNLMNWYKDDLESQNAVIKGLSGTSTNGFGEAEANLQTKTGQKIPYYFTACSLVLEDEKYFVGIGLDISKRKKAQEELLELNRTLEEKVELRTNQLTASNEALLRSNEELTAMNEEMTAMNEDLIASNEKIIQMQSYLVETEKMAALGELVAGVSHEINTPLGVGITASSHLVDMTTELLSKIPDDQFSKEDLKDFLEDLKKASSIIEKNLTRAGKLTQSFKQLSVDYSSQPKRIFNIKQHLNEILLSLSPLFKKTNIKITAACDEAIKVNGYPGPFAQIITNLVINALHHAYKLNDFGLIQIKVKQNKDTIHIIFKDDGIGMSPQTLSKIFEPFFTTKRGQGGTGLGLSILYSIVTQQFKGSVQCSSQLNLGTTFDIFLKGGD